MASKVYWHKKLIFLLFSFLVIFFGCKQKSYSYNNLLEESYQNNFPELKEYFLSYADSAYAVGRLEKGWQIGYIGKENYNYSSALTLNNELEVDINCRMAAFLLIREKIQCNNDLSNDFQVVDILPEDWSKHDKELFQLFFGQFEKGADYLKRWSDFGVSILGDFSLLTAWQNGKNLHAGVVFQEDQDIYFLEKVDPILPFQLSKFDSFSTLEEYILQGRFKGKSDVDLFLNDAIFADILKQ